MNWPREYLEAMRRGEEIVGVKVRTVYEREVGWMDEPPEDFPYVFDEDCGQAYIDFIETFCCHSKGKLAGQPIQLELFQKAKIQLVFGWRHREERTRRFREVIDLRGRKCGKSTETAGVAWAIAAIDGEPGAEIYCCANKLDQAKIIFDAAVAMRQYSPVLMRISRKRQGDIFLPASLGFIKAVAADSSTLDGLNVHFFAQDEWHAAKTSAIYDVMTQATSARDQPLGWLISTNGFVRGGFFDDKYEEAENVALWKPGHEDYTVLALLYELDKREEWLDPTCWAKANPGLGKIKKLSTLERFVAKARRNPSFYPTVMTKDFNMPESEASSWLTYDEAANDTVVGLDFLRDSYAIGGCDLSSTTDLTCATLLIRKPNDPNIYVLQKYFLPRVRAEQVAAKDKPEAPYLLWAEKGWLSLSEGATVDYHAVTEWFADMVRTYNIRPLWIGYDAALSGYWREEMVAYGFEMEKIRQGAYTWTYPMKLLHGAFEEHRVIYERNPMLRWCLLNTGVRSLNKDGIESQQPVKVSAVRRIDGMVSLLNAWTCYRNHEEEYLRYVR